MDSFNTSREAKDYVVQRILEQAAIEGVQFGDTERRLLCGNPTDQEIEAFESKDEDSAECLWDTVAALVRNGLKEQSARGGPESRREYVRAIALSAQEGDYLSSILQVTGVAHPDVLTAIKSRFWRWLLLAVICIVCGIGLPLLLMFLAPSLERTSDQIQASSWVRTLRFIVNTYGAITLAALLVGSWVIVLGPWLVKNWKMRR